VQLEKPKSTQDTHLQVPAVLESLGTISDHIVACAREAGLDDHAVWEVQLAVDEAATNIILHAYGDNDLDGPLIIKSALRGDEFTIHLHDKGAPFDPDAVPAPDLTSPVEERKTGGLGVYLMRTLMDRVEFQFDVDGYNVVTLVKRLPLAHLRFVRLSGRIDAAAAPTVQRLVREAAREGPRCVVIDLADVSFLSSSGLRILLLLTRELRKQHSDMRLCSPRPQVAEVFHLTGFDQIFELYGSREAAIESCSRD
jgi:anti-anti-sigma factor